MRLTPPVTVVDCPDPDCDQRIPSTGPGRASHLRKHDRDRSTPPPAPKGPIVTDAVRTAEEIREADPIDRAREALEEELGVIDAELAALTDRRALVVRLIDGFEELRPR